MNTRTLDFYEFTGILVPGVLFLLGMGYLAPPGAKIAPLLLPENVGAAVIHLVLAYGVGHLVQAIGNFLETGYWWVQSGMPTDWPFSKPTREFPLSYREPLLTWTDGGDVNSIDDWRRRVAIARAAIMSRGLGARLLTFNGNYGMFRGMAAIGVLFLLVAWYFRPNHLLATYALILAATILATYRMHRFAKHYGKEFFASVSLLKSTLGESA
jgi:hypothetical protein